MNNSDHLLWPHDDEDPIDWAEKADLEYSERKLEKHEQQQTNKENP